MDRPARAVSGLTPVGQGAVRGRRGARAAAWCRAATSCPDRWRPRGDLRRRGVFPRGARRARREPRRTRGAALSFARGRSVSRAVAAHRRDIGARARPARHRPGTARIVIASAAALLPRVTAPERLLAAALELKPGQDIAPTDLGGAARRRRVHPRGSGRRARRVRSSRRHRRHFPGRRNASGPPGVHRRHHRDAAHLRPVDAAIDRRRSIRSPIVPLRDVLDDDRRATLFDYLLARKRSAIIVSERDEVEAHAAKRARADCSQSYEDDRRRSRAARSRPRRWPPTTVDAVRRAGRSSRRLATRSQLRARASTTPRDHARARDDALTAQRTSDASRRSRTERPRGRLGRRDPRGSATRAKPTLFVAATPAAPSGRSSCSRNTTSSRFRSSAPKTPATPRCWSPSAACRAAFGCPTPGCRSTPRRTSSRRSAARPSGAGRPPRRFSPICATSRSATSSSTSTTASACSSA